MSKKRSDRHLPEEVLGFLSTIFFLPAVAVIGILGTMLFLPSITTLQPVDTTKMFLIGLAAGVVGSVLLFFARLPLYRQRRFFTFGPRELDRLHCFLYWLAYLFVVASVVFFGVVWLSLR